MKKRIVAAIIICFVIVVAGTFGYIKFNGSRNDKKPEKRIGFPLELMKTTKQSVTIDGCTMTLTHYLYDEYLQIAHVVFQVTSEENMPRVQFNHEGYLEGGFGSECGLAPRLWACKGEYKDDVLYLYGMNYSSSSLSEKNHEEKKTVFALYPFFSLGMDNPLKDLKFENTEEGFSLTIPEGNTIYLSSVGFYIENMSVEAVTDMSLHFKDGTEQTYIKDKKIKAKVTGIKEQPYMDRYMMEFDFNYILDMDNLEYVIVNGERYDVE